MPISGSSLWDWPFLAKMRDERWEMGMAQQQKPPSWMNNPQPQSHNMSVQIGIRATRNPLSSRERHQRANVPLLNLQLNVLCRLLVCSADIFSTISSIIQFVCELLHKHLRSPGFFWFISQCPGYGLGLNVGCSWYRSFQEKPLNKCLFTPLSRWQRISPAC